MSIALFRDVANASELRSALLSGSIFTVTDSPREEEGGDQISGKSVDVALVKAPLLLDVTQALVASNKAILAQERGSMITRCARSTCTNQVCPINIAEV